MKNTGAVRSGTLLTAGLAHLQRLRERAVTTIIARNRWELTRCMETMNLLDLGELVFRAALERKETRGLHVQPDYPLTDPMLDGKNLFITRRDGQPVLEWRTLD